MLFALPPAEIVSMPAETPIACQVCKHETTQLFSGTVKLAEGGRLQIFNGKTHQTMGFTVPADFRGVDSSDGVIKGGPLAKAVPGLLARVTYRTIDGHHVPSQVLLLTINQCRALEAAEKIGHVKTGCPD
jgi:hypothetical protein